MGDNEANDAMSQTKEIVIKSTTVIADLLKERFEGKAVIYPVLGNQSTYIILY